MNTSACARAFVVAALAWSLAACQTAPSTPASTATPAPTATPGTTAAAPWVPAGSMAEPRWNHTATLLADGRVLVAGGSQRFLEEHPEAVTLSSVELFDPATGAWTEGPPMPGPRRSHHAIRLLDGRVLVVGGIAVPEPFGEREPAVDSVLFDPATNTWSRIGGVTAQGWANLLLLSDGRVLLTEATVSQLGFTQTISLFDPATNTWTRSDASRDVRGQPVGLLSDGSVLMASSPVPTVDGGANSAAWRYVPSDDRWEELKPMPKGITIATSTQLSDGRVLLVGAEGSVIYGNATSAWEETTVRLGAESSSATLLQDGRVAFVGAWDCIGANLPAQVFDPGTGGSRLLEPPPAADGLTATLLSDGRLLLAGGGPACDNVNERQGPVAHAYLFDPATIP